MLKLSSSTKYMYIPVTGPSGLDLTTLPVSVAMIPEAAGGEPGTNDYKSATWKTTPDGQTEAVVLISAGDYPDGEYLAFVRVVAAPEDIREYSGRVRIGDART